MKRFVIEYANDKIKRLEEEQKRVIMCANANDVLGVNTAYNNAIETITKTVFNCEYGYIDIDTAMLIISEPFKHVWEVLKK